MADQKPGTTSGRQREGLLAELIRNAQTVWRLLRDPRVPLTTKLIIPALAGAYLLWPVDLLPDVFPLLGQLDDLAILALALRLFMQLVPPDILRQYETGAGDSSGGRTGSEGETVDAEFRVVE